MDLSKRKKSELEIQDHPVNWETADSEPDKKIIKMECQVEKNEHFRHLLLFAFNQGSKAAKAARDICAVYEEDAIAERTAPDWYAKLKNGNIDLKDAPRSGRPVEFDEERLNSCTKISVKRQGNWQRKWNAPTML